MKQGHSAAWDQQWDRAIAAYRKAAEEFPDDPDALASLGLALLENRELDSALAIYERAARISPADPVPLEKSAEVLERQGRFDDASPRYMAVADLHLSRRDVDKAVINWARAARLTPDLLLAHQRLSLAYERTGKRGPAVTAYLNVARLLQMDGDYSKAMEAAEKARALEPRNSDVLRAIDMLQRGLPLPRIRRPGGVTDALRAVRAAFAPPDAQGEPPSDNGKPIEPLELDADSAAGNNPAEASRQRALAKLAAYLFDTAADEDRANEEGGLFGFGGRKQNRAEIISNLAHAMDSQRRNDSAAALDAFEKAEAAGMDQPAGHLCLGLLYADEASATDATRRSKAVKHLQAAAADPQLRTGANFALAGIQRAIGKPRDALRTLLEVLQDVDLQTVAPAKAEQLAQLYEPVAEEMLQTDDEAQVEAAVRNVVTFLSGPGWLERVRAARHQLDSTSAEVDGSLAPLAEVLSMPGTERVIESMRLIDQYLEHDHLSSAMDEAFNAVEVAPTYLPIHLRIGEILFREDRVQAAIAKYTAVAETYEVRGDVQRASHILERVIRLAPMDPGARSRLIKLLLQENRIDEALSQHLDLAEAYYRLADLTGARQTFTNALRLAQKSSGERAWSVQILHAMADIDVQRLDWRQALRVFQQIKSMAPTDEKARTMIVDLSFRLGQTGQAIVEVDDWLRYQLQQGQVNSATAFLEELVRQRPEEAGLRTRLARLYQERGRKADAIAQLEALSELQIRAGQPEKAADTIRAILALGPESAGSYQQLLAQLESGQR
jgi:tetratricopeptide (TPR) repeat protein